MIKTCKTCRIEKDIESFIKKGGGIYGSECKECYNIKRIESGRNKIACKKYRERYLLKEKNRINEWKKTERGKLSKTNSCHKRRRIKKDSDITIDYLKLLKEFVGDICPYCLEISNEWHLDHIVPLKLNGKHKKGNVIFCCPKCNIKKGIKTFEEIDYTYFK